MYQTIVVAFSLDQGLGGRAMAMARALRAEGGKIFAVHVLEPVPNYANLYLTDSNDQEIRETVEKQMAERIGDEKDADTVVLVGHPGRAITDYSEEVGADCIVVGSHDPELQDTFLGSTAARIVRHASCSVHVLR